MKNGKKVIEIKFQPFEILHPNQRKKSQAYLVNKLRDAVFNWRNNDYPNVTKTTKRLLEFWFKEDHIVEDKEFKFWFAQREAIETLIYVYEVMRKRRFVELAQDFGEGRIIYNPEIDQYPLYCFKMATGTGKTFVMAFAVVWSYFNYKFEKLDDYTNKFLLVTPNVIVYERLKRDFEDGKIFKKYPFIPDEWRPLFDLRIILREDPVPNVSENVFFLTNIQQLEEKRTQKKKNERMIEEALTLPEVKKTDIYQENRIKEVLSEFPNIMILKDEAHHIYSVEKAWKRILLNLHSYLKTNFGKGINMELDFTATPKEEKKGRLFPWIIVDFSLKEAIEMGIVKYPLKGIIRQHRVFASSKISERFRRWIDAALQRWREYKKVLQKLEKKSVLFIQCPTNKDADDVYNYICTLPFIQKDKVLLIHTDSTGEIKKSELPRLRELAKNIDQEESPIEVIVSTMMLNEGWDVKSVNIILGLRSYTSPRKILPEQVIGRGLRKAFPELNPNIEKCVNTLEIIGPPALLDIIDQLEKEEGIKIGEVDIEEPPPDITIYVDEKKSDKNIKIPILEPKYIRAEMKFTEEDYKNLPTLKFDFEKKALEDIVKYEAKDYLKGITLVKREWILPVPKDIHSVIGYYADQIRKELKIPKSFSEFYPLVERYVSEKLFKKKLNLSSTDLKEKSLILYNLIRPEVKEGLFKVFEEAFKEKMFTTREVGSFTYKDFSSVKPFIWTKLVYPAKKCIFNLCPCDNNLELEFAKFLENVDDVDAFSKNEGIGFFIEYISTEKLLRNYKPDFVIRLKNNQHWIVETKGAIGIDVPLKDKRAMEWCKDATSLTGIKWNFMRINQDKFQEYQDKLCKFKDLVKLIKKYPNL